MKKLTFTLIFILSVPLILSSFIHHRYEHEFAICAIFKDEAPYLKEWIDYHHHILGATHLYLYNNDSSDNYQDVLRPYIKDGIVELIDWKSCEKNAIHSERDGVYWISYQRGAYNDCLKNRALGKARWVAIIDIDEFIVPVQGVESFQKLLKQPSKFSLKLLLKNFNRHRTVGSFKLHWLVFGTSNVWDIDSEEFLTEKLTLRAPDNHRWHLKTKCIHHPEAIELCHVHNAILTKKYKQQNLKIPEFRLHHYWSGPEKKLVAKRKLSKEKVEKFIKEFNVIEDKTIYRYLQKLKEVAR